MKKADLMYFTLAAWEAGAKPFLSDGREVPELVHLKTVKDYPLIGLDNGVVCQWSLNGQTEGKSYHTLMLEAPTVTRFINTYKEGLSKVYNTHSDANEGAVDDRLGCLKVVVSGTSVTTEYFPTK